jgi:hypothetical protein
MSCKLVHPVITPPDKDLRSAGKVMDAKDVQFRKASLFMVVTESGITTDGSEEQPSNVELLMVLMRSGIIIDAKLLQP